MARQIFVNLPVKDLLRSRTFFTTLGFGFEPRFANEESICVVVGHNIYVMLLTETFFGTFTTKPLCDATKNTEALICISCDSREDVDALVTKAAAAGGNIPRPAQDHGFMYGHAFEDPDGHIWELIYMRPGFQA